MTLTFILNVKGEDVTGQVLPRRAAADGGALMLEDVADAVLKVRDAVAVRVPEFHIVVAGAA